MELKIRCRCPLTSNWSLRIHSNPPGPVETSQQGEYPNCNHYLKFCTVIVKQFYAFHIATYMSNISLTITHFKKLREVFVIWYVMNKKILQF
jgi:hypothetical protein